MYVYCVQHKWSRVCWGISIILMKLSKIIVLTGSLNLSCTIFIFNCCSEKNPPKAKTTRFFSSSPLCGKDKMVPTGSNHWGANQMSRAQDLWPWSLVWVDLFSLSQQQKQQMSRAWEIMAHLWRANLPAESSDGPQKLAPRS